MMRYSKKYIVAFLPLAILLLVILHLDKESSAGSKLLGLMQEVTKGEEGVFMQRDRLFLDDTKPMIDADLPLRLETATLAMGWFWGPDARFGQIRGVYRTRVGYAGGILENPTYRHLGDHTESLQIDYDPGQISYEEVLQFFWDNHNPSGRPWSKQYMSIIFYHSEEQKLSAFESREQMEQKIGVKIYTEIVPVDIFYLAEDYHQKYYLQGEPELAEGIKAVYPEFSDFINSTVAARLNGIVAGYGNPDLLAQELDSYGLSPSGRELLQKSFN